jgi:hypothetical protein
VRRSLRAAPTRGGALGFAALVVMLVGLIVPSGAAARGLVTGLDDPIDFTAASSAVRSEWFGKAKSANAGIVRIDVSWRDVAGSRPANPVNPADPAYHFAAIDGGVRSAAAAGLPVLLNVEHAPSWAEGKNRPRSVPAGSWKPNATAFGHFGQAIATRYSGHFGGLPRVKYFQAWNEPNLTVHLAPQWKGKKPASPDMYRRMLNAFYAGVNAAQPTAVVLNGGTAPYGDSPGKTRMHPLTFLRNLLCLNGHLKPTRCPVKPHLDVLAHHPITDGSPTKHAFNRNDVPVADFHKVKKVLNAAERAHRIQPGGHHPLWATELWWNTKPPNKFGFPVSKQAKWIEQALYMLWKQGASTVINYELRDFPYDPKNAANTLQSGLFFHNGKAKPSYRTFRFPFVTHRKSKARVGVWGKAPDSGSLEIQRKTHKRWTTVKRLQVKRGQVFQARVRQRGSATFRARVGGSTSAPWHQD